MPSAGFAGCRPQALRVNGDGSQVPCPIGGTGRRARLKIEFRKECWFDSGMGHHQTLPANFHTLPVNPKNSDFRGPGAQAREALNERTIGGNFSTRRRVVGNRRRDIEMVGCQSSPGPAHHLFKRCFQMAAKTFRVEKRCPQLSGMELFPIVPDDFRIGKKLDCSRDVAL